LAARHLSAALQQRESPEDVAQSVCRTFFRRARDGEFKLNDSNGLWRLLCVITMTKTREKARYHGRDKRSWKRERRLAHHAEDSVPGIWQLASTQPDPQEAVDLADQVESLAAKLHEEERMVLTMKLDHKENREIARQLGCSERTVRRILERLQSRLRKELEESLLDG
jgi:RNA polymerase sigma-70 factor (ECF subfamily)